jgi:hypothetical protein
VRPSRPFGTSVRLALGDDRSRRLAFADKATTEAQTSNHQSQRECDFLHEAPPSFVRTRSWTPTTTIHIGHSGRKC